MRHLLFCLAAFSLSYSAFSQNTGIGIGTTNPHPSAILDLSNDSKGMLIPRMTAHQRNNIAAPAEGLMIYQTDSSQGFWYFDGTVWSPLVKMPAGGADGQVLTYCRGLLVWTNNGVCPGMVSDLNCNSIINNGVLTSRAQAINVNSILNYTGGNGGPIAAQTISSTGVTGLTASLSAGNLQNGSGSLIFNITGVPDTMGTAVFSLNVGGKTCTLSRTVEAPIGSVSSLQCYNAISSGNLVSGVPVTQTIQIPYTGGDGGPYAVQSINSQFVSGLTLNLPAGNFSVGNGVLIFTITGTPTTSGVAVFVLDMGGQVCQIYRTVFTPGGNLGVTNHSCGSTNVHNPSLPYGTMTDQSGIVYKTIQIGSQIWMAENLKTTRYRNNDLIPQVTDNTQWSNTTTGASCSYNNDSTNDCPTGKLYNSYAVSDPRGLCPAGWHVPSNSDYLALMNLLDPNCGDGLQYVIPNNAGGKLKSAGSQYWTGQFDGATNETGFSALPVPMRNSNGNFVNINMYLWWTGNVFNGSLGWEAFELGFNSASAYLTLRDYNEGHPVRCVKD